MYAVNPPAKIPKTTETAHDQHERADHVRQQPLVLFALNLERLPQLAAALLGGRLAGRLGLGLGGLGGGGIAGFRHLFRIRSGRDADRLRIQPPGPIRRPHQRPGQHAGEADRLREPLVLDELLGLDPALHRVVAHRRPQVLGDGDDVAAGLVKVGQRGAHLVRRLTHAEDEVGLGDQPVVTRRGQHRKAALVAERGPDPLEDARNGFDVVRQHFWA